MLTGKKINIGYSYDGNEIEDLNSLDCFAKEIYDRDSKTNLFLIRKGVSGFNIGSFINPYDEPINKKEYEFVKVTQFNFDLFIKFLKTHNKRYFYQIGKF